MPASDLLSTGDGRPNSHSVARQEPYYSNDEIKIVYEVVTRGEEKLAADAKGNITPTFALFAAAEDVLPQYGLDPEEPRLSRLLFKIGGERRETLLQKFWSRLETMGIEITLDGLPFKPGDGDIAEQEEPAQLEPDPPAEAAQSSSQPPPAPTSPSAKSASVASVSATSRSQAPSGFFPIAPRLNGRRRRNSDTVATLAPEDGTDKNRPPLSRVRSASLVLDPGGADVPNQPPANQPSPDAGPSGRAAELKDRYLAKWLGGVGGNGKAVFQARADTTTDTEVPRAHQARLATFAPTEYDDSLDADEVVDVDDESSAYQPVDDDILRRLQLPMRPSNPTPPGDTSQEADESRNGETNHSTQVFPAHRGYHRQPGIHGRAPLHGLDVNLPREPSDAHSYEFRPNSGNPAPSQPDPTKSEFELRNMELKLRDFQNRNLESSLMAWARQFRETSAKNDAMETWAAMADRNGVIEDAAVRWREEARVVARETQKQRERDAQAARREERMMRRAGRAYDLSIMYLAFTQWKAAADLEKERTEVARRHLLRKKVFDAWTSKTADDKAKVKQFAGSRIFDAWRSAAQKQRDTHELALQLYPDRLARVTFAKLRREHQERLAITWRSTRVKEGCVHTWRLAVQRSAGQESIAIDRWSLRARTSTLSTWRSHSVQLRTQGAEAVQTFQKQTLDQHFGFLKKTAALERLLRKAVESRELKMKAGAIDLWRAATTACQEQQRACQQSLLRELLKHWRLELKLKRFSGEMDHYTLLESSYQWVLEERLVLFRRYTDYSLMASTVVDLQQSAREETARQERLAQLADQFRKRTQLQSFVGAMRSQMRDHEDMAHVATQTELDQIAGDALRMWTIETVRHHAMENDAQRGAFYVGAIECLSTWPGIAKAAREERLRTTYHRFRREYKRGIAADCMSIWREAAQDQLHAEWRFEEARRDQALHETIDWLNVWIGETNRMIGVGTIAAEAEVEAAAASWRLRAEELRTAEADAGIYDANRLVAKSMEDWELESVKMRGRQHTALELCDKGNRRLCRHSAVVWLQQTLAARGRVDGGDATALGSRTPLLSSSRRGAAQGPSLNQVGRATTAPPVVPHSQSRHQRSLSRPSPDDFGSSFSQPMPASWFAGASTMSRFSTTTNPSPNTAPLTLPFTPRAPPPLPPADEQEGQPHQPQQSLSSSYYPPPNTGGRNSVLPPISERSEGSTRAFAASQSLQRFQGSGAPAFNDNDEDEDGGDASRSHAPPAADRLRSFREKLRSATVRFDDSVQLDPMSEFDADEDEDNDVAENLQGRSSSSPVFNRVGAGSRSAPPAVGVGAAVLDTPSRWTGIPGPVIPSRGAAGGGRETFFPSAAATTTPMAPLPSPMERQLRSQYAPPPPRRGEFGAASTSRLEGGRGGIGVGGGGGGGGSSSSRAGASRSVGGGGGLGGRGSISRPSRLGG